MRRETPGAVSLAGSHESARAVAALSLVRRREKRGRKDYNGECLQGGQAALPILTVNFHNKRDQQAHTLHTRRKRYGASHQTTFSSRSRGQLAPS
jgi:hypothetical protein